MASRPTPSCAAGSVPNVNVQGMLARARASIGAVPSGAALSVEFGEREVHRGIGFKGALLREAWVVLFLAPSGGPGAVGVVQGVAGQAEEVVQLDEGFLDTAVVRVVGVLAEPPVDVAQERADVDVSVTRGLRGDLRQPRDGLADDQCVDKEVVGQGAPVRAGGDPAEQCQVLSERRTR